MINDPWSRIIRKWLEDKNPIRAGASAEEIAAFEFEYHVVLPYDVREYFLTVDGTGDEMTNEWYYRFWPLAEVKPVHEVLGDVNAERFSYPDCFVFADHCINCWLYAVKLTQDPNQAAAVFQVCGGYAPREEMSSSFREFMTRYADDDKNIV